MAVASDQLSLVWATPKGLRWLAAVNHRSIGIRYIVTAFTFFLIGGILALLMRWQLRQAENDFLDPEQYNQIFTMHGTTMMFLFAVPIMEGLAMYLVPLMVGARDAPFPRLNSFGYFCFLFGGLILYSSIFFGAMPNGGWFSYPPLTGDTFSPGVNMDFWLLGVTLTEFSAIAAGVEIVVLVIKGRAPGMSIDRMPLFVWNVMAIMFAILVAFPALVVASVLLELDRAFDTAFYVVGLGGDPLLWQHLFWIFGHPEVYIQFLPGAGIISMVIPTFSRRAIVGYLPVAFAAVATAFLSFGLWVHHMFATGLPPLSLSFFSAASFMVAIPAGIQIFAWILTVWTGRPVFTTAFLYALGFIVIFVGGGVTGVMLAVVPFNLQAHDTFFVVAHFHYVLVGGVLFPVLAALHYWVPKMSGRLMSESWGKLSFWLVFIGFNVAFFPLHIVGLLGMPRRVYTFDAGLGWDIYNLISTMGALILATGIFVLVVNILVSIRRGPRAGNDPWNAGTLEWAASSPPAPYNFRVIPTVRARYPLWDQDTLEPPDRVDDPTLFYESNGQRRETPTTTGIDATPEGLIGLPTPTHIPLGTAIAVAAAFIGVLSEQYLISYIALVVALLLVVAWHWPKSSEDFRIIPVEDPETRALFGFVPPGYNTGWWGTVLFLLSNASIMASCAFAYLFLWGRATAWPPEGIDRPELVLPIIGFGLLFVAMIVGLIGQRGAARNRWLLATICNTLAMLFSAGFLVLQWLDFAQVDFRPDTNAYGSVYFLVTGYVAVNVLIQTLLHGWTALHGFIGARNQMLLGKADVAGLYAVFNVVAAGAMYLLAYGMPYLGATEDQIRL